MNKILLFFLLGLAGCGLKKERANHTAAPGQITWDQSTLARVSTGAERYCSYPRIIQLQDRSLLAIYEADGGVQLRKSENLGMNWSAPSTIAVRAEGVNMAVPEILELKDRTLLAFYNPRPSRSAKNKRFGIRVVRSRDGGRSWQDDQLIYEAGEAFENGCWEPAALQLPNGEVQVFFANEADYTTSNEQNISLLRSLDNGLHWSKKAEIASFRKGSRDGMPVPVLLRNANEIAFVIEDNGFRNFKPYIIRNTLKENWAFLVDANSPNRNYALADSIPDSIYAGSPYLRRLKSGQTVLSYQGTEGRINDMKFADMKVLVGDERALNFKHKTNPFTIPGNKSCLWNSLCILADDTIIAITSTNAYADRSEIWMIKGKLR